MLHVYAGLISLYLAQPTPLAERSAEGRTLRDAQQYFDRARLLSPHDPVTSSWLEKVRLAKKKPAHSTNTLKISSQIPLIGQGARDRAAHMSDDEDISIDDAGQRQKRART